MCPRKQVTDVDWKVEQRLSKLLAERDLYTDGFIYGFLLAAVFAVIALVAVYPDKILAAFGKVR